LTRIKYHLIGKYFLLKVLCTTPRGNLRRPRNSHLTHRLLVGSLTRSRAHTLPKGQRLNTITENRSLDTGLPTVVAAAETVAVSPH